MGGTNVTTLDREHASRAGKHDRVVNYRHVIHALRRKPLALLNLVCRDKLFPREAFRRTFDALLDQLPERQACRTMVDLLAMAHERNCESELADHLTLCLDARRLPDMRALRHQFSPDPAQLPNVVVHLAWLNDYQALLGSCVMGEVS